MDSLTVRFTQLPRKIGQWLNLHRRVSVLAPACTPLCMLAVLRGQAYTASQQEGKKENVETLTALWCSYSTEVLLGGGEEVGNTGMEEGEQK